MRNKIKREKSVAIVGGGPAGLMAAETLINSGIEVDLYDAMPSVARKFLLAGVGGMNITHSEPLEEFIPRYGAQKKNIEPLLQAFTPDALRGWVHDLGIETFVGSSGRVFPKEMKAAPLLRAWLHRLRESGVRIHVRHRWLGWKEKDLLFAASEGEKIIHADAVILALGGASWPKLGSDGAWVPILKQRQIDIAMLQPSNCGFEVSEQGWTEHFRTRFAGQPVKPVVAAYSDTNGETQHRQGEFIVTDKGVEGSLIYALSALLRAQINQFGSATLYLDLAPSLSLQKLTDEITHPRGSRSLSSHLQSRVNIKGVKMGLLRELLAKEIFNDAVKLAQMIKALPLQLTKPSTIENAISTAGGVKFEALDENLMLKNLPGVFCAGEMLDWEAPTGGYLLTACFASGKAAGQGVVQWLLNDDSMR
jgi:uncharacterized flavoprotein (TIGR03862 family)